MLPFDLSTLDKLRIYEVIEFRHITANDKQDIMEAIDVMKGRVKGAETGHTRSSSDSNSTMMGLMAVTAAGAIAFFGAKKFAN